MMHDSAAPGTLAHEALQFLRHHPEASTSTLSAGLGRNPKRLLRQLQDALLAGILMRTERGSMWMWSVGPNADIAQSTEANENAREVIKVSAMAAPSVFAYADQRGAAPFSVSLATDGRVTIERYGRIVLELTSEERHKLIRVASCGVRS